MRTIPFRTFAARCARRFAFFAFGTFGTPFGALEAGFGGPGEGVENLHLGRGCFGFGGRFNHGDEDRHLFRDRLTGGYGGGGFGRNLGQFRSFDRLDLGAFGFLGLVAQTCHQIGKLVQRHAGDRQHVWRRFKTSAAVFLAQDVGEAFQHVDADRARPCRMIARKRVMLLGHLGHIGDGHKARRRAFGEFLQPVEEGPQHQPQPGGGGFQKGGQENGELAETDAMLAQGTTGFLIQLFHFVRHSFAGKHTHRLGQAKRKAAGKAGQSLIPAHGEKGFELGGNLAVDEMLQPAADLFHHFGAGFFIDEGVDQRLGGISALDKLAHRVGAPHEAALFGEIKLGVGRVVEAVGAQVKFGPERLNCGLRQCAGRIGRGAGVLPEAEAFQLARKLAFDGDFTLVVHFGHESLLLLQPAKENRCPPVNKSLCQSCVKRV